MSTQKEARIVLERMRLAEPSTSTQLKKGRGRGGRRKKKCPTVAAASAQTQQKPSFCANCFSKVTFENMGRSLSEPLHRRGTRSKLEKILEDRTTRDRTTVLQILDLIFDMSRKSRSAGLELDETSHLCWKCTIILTQLYKLFLEFIEAAEIPSVMKSIFQHNPTLVKFQDALREREEEMDVDVEETGEEDGVTIKLEPQSEDDSGGANLTYAPVPTRGTRKPRCKRPDYKKLSMGKVDFETDVEPEYILPGPTESINQSPVSTRVLLAEKAKRIIKRKEKKQAVAEPQLLKKAKIEADSDDYDENYTPEDDEFHCLNDTQDDSKMRTMKRIRSLSKKKKLKDRSKEDSNAEKVPCPVCKRDLKSEELLQEHLSEKHVPLVRVRNHLCLECAKLFWTKHDLNNHIKTHTREASYVCDTCGYKTKRPQELTRHQKIVHLNEKNYYCEICNKGYALRWQLKDHARVHRPERTFPCPYDGCDKSFRTPSNLRQHVELHKGSKYVCHVCGQTYSRKAYLRLHVNAAHFGKPFPIPKKKELDPNRPVRPRLARTKIVGDVPPERPRRLRKEITINLNANANSSPTNKMNRDNMTPAPKKIEPKTIITVSDQNQADSFVVTKESHCQEEGEGEGEQVLVLTEYNPDEHDLELITEEQVEGEILEAEELQEDGSIKMVQVQMQLDEEGMLGVEGEDVEQHHYSITEDQQIICYPVDSMGVVQRIPVAITAAMDGSNNTYYITTAQQEDTDGQGAALGVLNPFHEFMSLQ